MSLQGYYDNMQSGLWAEVNPTSCPCRGNGWLLSQVDTWHRCPVHGQGVPSPDPDADDSPGFNFAGHLVEMQRQAYRHFQVASGLSREAFRKAVEAVTVGRSPSDLVDAAEIVSEERCQAAEDAAAIKRGFSCALEARWADDAADEGRD